MGGGARAHRAGERVANNPLYLADVTPWPVNISWALLANRRSCFAGRELTLAYVPLPDARREEINAKFIRVFAGQGSAEDVRDFAQTYHCRVIVLTPSDGAWNKDPFAASPLVPSGRYESGSLENLPRGLKYIVIASEAKQSRSHSTRL